MRILFTVMLALCLLGLTGNAAANTIYKWTDGDGTVTYGQFPPEGVDAEPVDDRSSPGRVTEDRNTRQSASSNEREAEQEDTASEGRREVDADDEEGMAAACEQARENVAVLENPAVRRVRDSSGESRILEPEEREARLQENQAFIDEWC